MCFKQVHQSIRVIIVRQRMFQYRYRTLMRHFNNHTYIITYFSRFATINFGLHIYSYMQIKIYDEIEDYEVDTIRLENYSLDDQEGTELIRLIADIIETYKEQQFND